MRARGTCVSPYITATGFHRCRLRQPAAYSHTHAGNSGADAHGNLCAYSHSLAYCEPTDRHSLSYSDSHPSHGYSLSYANPSPYGHSPSYPNTGPPADVVTATAVSAGLRGWLRLMGEVRRYRVVPASGGHWLRARVRSGQLGSRGRVLPACSYSHAYAYAYSNATASAVHHCAA